MLKRAKARNRQQVFVDQGNEVRAPAGEKSGRVSAADIKRCRNDMPVQFGFVSLGVLPGTDEALLFTVPKCETNGAFRFEPEPYDLSRNIDEHNHVDAVVERARAKIV